MRAEIRRRPNLRRIGLLLSGGALAALVVFHLALLAERLRDLSIFEPRIAFQWLGAGILLAFLVRLARRGKSVLSGRSALAFWSLVLLLHLVPHVPAPQAAGGDLLLALPSTWVAIGLGLLAWAHPGRRAVCPIEPVAESPWSPGLHATDTGFAATLLARPPPVPLG